MLPHPLGIGCNASLLPLEIPLVHHDDAALALGVDQAADTGILVSGSFLRIEDQQGYIGPFDALDGLHDTVFLQHQADSGFAPDAGRVHDNIAFLTDAEGRVDGVSRGTSCTMTRSYPKMRLMREDLPTLGLPTTAILVAADSCSSSRSSAGRIPMIASIK